MEQIVKQLLGNTQLALIVIGLFFVAISAFGGIEQWSLRIEDPVWRIVIAVSGFIVAVFGALLMWVEGKDTAPSALKKRARLKITAPPNNVVADKVQLVGTYRKRPPEGSVVILERSATSGEYWFKGSALLFDEARKQWSAECSVRGDPDNLRVFCIAVMGRSSQIFRDYYFRVNRDVQNRKGFVELPPDVEICDQVQVRRRR